MVVLFADFLVVVVIRRELTSGNDGVEKLEKRMSSERLKSLSAAMMVFVKRAVVALNEIH
jgi:hypothetical protein